jgi:hypothetical protein
MQSRNRILMLLNQVTEATLLLAKAHLVLNMPEAATKLTDTMNESVGVDTSQ